MLLLVLLTLDSFLWRLLQCFVVLLGPVDCIESLICFFKRFSLRANLFFSFFKICLTNLFDMLSPLRFFESPIDSGQLISNISQNPLFVLNPGGNVARSVPAHVGTDVLHEIFFLFLKSLLRFLKPLPSFAFLEVCRCRSQKLTEGFHPDYPPNSRAKKPFFGSGLSRRTFLQNRE